MANMLKAAAVLLATVAMGACDSGPTTATADTAGASAGGTTEATRDWTQTVVETPEGGFRMGNPDARVRIVEFASFTCGVCQQFHMDAQQHLKPNYIRTGQVSYEYRPFVLNPWDIIAASIARCEGADRFFVWADELYSNHEAWVGNIGRVREEDIRRLGALPPEQQLVGAADAAGFNEFVRPRGLPRARFEQCLASENFERLSRQRDQAMADFQISGTPTFLLNGRKLDGVGSWAQLQPRIAEAL
jgi:protein-disulfide isomerase